MKVTLGKQKKVGKVQNQDIWCNTLTPRSLAKREKKKEGRNSAGDRGRKGTTDGAKNE